MQKLNIFIYWLNKLQNTNIGFLLYLYLKKSDKDVKTFNRFIGDNQMVVTKIIQAITLFNKFLSAIEQKREYINKWSRMWNIFTAEKYLPEREMYMWCPKMGMSLPVKKNKNRIFYLMVMNQLLSGRMCRWQNEEKILEGLNSLG